MFEELNHLAGWDSSNLPYNKLILISSENSDGSFLIHHFLSLFLKADANVILITAAQGFSHYNVICSKLGVNLERFKSSTKLKVLNLLGSSLFSYLEKQSQVEIADEDVVKALDYNSLEYLYHAITKLLNTDSRNVVILDDLSVMLSIGFPEDNLVTFLHYMKVLSIFSNCGFVTNLQKDVLSENHGPFLYQHCQHYSSYEFQIRGLDSGYCKDVHGNLDFFSKSDNLLKRPSVRQMQYKLTDRSLKLFAPGTSSAVL